MIPKTIHYCWFGGNPLPDSALKCIASWKRYCPDYEIVEWNENNFDINCCNYVKEAYQAGKWAFVSDYARFKILYECGGLYFDTDVEIIKPLDDIVMKGNFMGRENNPKFSVAPGLGLGATAGLDIYKKILDKYDELHFLNNDGTFNLKTVVDYTTEILTIYGLNANNKISQIANINIYPYEYFCPINYNTGEITLTPNTHSIHHYSASWYSPTQRYALDLKRKYGKFLPHKIAAICATAMSITKYEGFNACLKWILKKRR